MHQLAKLTLENEMDLILAHKRSMKLAELAGLSLSAQTTFATAVSEVLRGAIDNGKRGSLILSVLTDQRERYIVATLVDNNGDNKRTKEGIAYAKKLVNKMNVSENGNETTVELFYYVSPPFRIDIQKLDEWRSIFRNEPPISPYEELKRKNEQLLELAGKLKESEDHYRELTDTLPLMMFSLHENGDLAYANKWMVDYFGYSLEQLKSMNRSVLVHEEDRPAEVTVKDIISKKQPATAQWRIKDKYDNYIWHLFSIMPLYNQDKIGNWFGFLVDIHAQKMLEQALKDNRELKEVQEQLNDNIRELNRSNEELQEFAYVASHDLQEPLRKIIFYSDYIHKKHGAEFDTKSSGYLQSMISASQRMRVLISDLLSFSQVEKKKLEMKPVELDAVLSKAITTYDLTIKEKKAVIHHQPLPAIEGDEVLLQQLFENLLSNSLKYSKEDIPPQIDITATTENNMVKICFADNGIGFEEEFSSKIFTLFQRLHTKDKFSGTGLGLAICRKVAEMHNGSINVISSINNGACFCIHLPVKQKA